MYKVLTKPKTVGGLSYAVIPFYAAAIFIIFSLLPIKNILYKGIAVGTIALMLLMVLKTIIYTTKDDIFFDVIMNNIKNKNPKKVGF